jgi:hypothetical protein
MLRQEVIEAELRRAFVNMAPGRDWRAEGFVPVEEVYDLNALPPTETNVSKDRVRDFAEKQGWPLPRFWFPDEAPPVRQRGRPSDKDAILQEFERRAEHRKLAASVTAEARALAEWLTASGRSSYKAETVRKIISKHYAKTKLD